MNAILKTIRYACTGCERAWWNEALVRKGKQGEVQVMYYIESPSNDPYFNLALEQYVFDKLPQEHAYFMLWQNDNTIVVGKFQNTFGEINAQFVENNGVRVVRRLSGGGAVYHDMGNVNFTFITNDTGGAFDFSQFCRPVVKVLKQLGVDAEINGRNDMTIEGRKFSGNSQYAKHGRVMHHGTLMFDSDLTILEQALNVPKDKLESKGAASVRSRVTNIRPFLKHDCSVDEFKSVLRDGMFAQFDLRPYTLTDADISAVRKLQTQCYMTWEWNYGNSPQYSIQKVRRFENCGKVEVMMDVDGGCIRRIAFYGDYFGNGDMGDITRLLIGQPLQRAALSCRLASVDMGKYINNLSTEQFLEVLLQ